MKDDDIITTTVTTTTRRLVKVPKPKPRLIKRERKIVIRTRTASVKGAKVKPRVAALPVRTETVVVKRPRELPMRTVLELPASSVKISPARRG